MAPRKEEPAGIEIAGPGFVAKLRGATFTSSDLLIVLIILSCAGFLYWDSLRAGREFVNQHAVTQKMLGNVLSNQAIIINEVRNMGEKIESGGEIQVYVLTLSQSQREKLNLSMPSKLRERMRNNQQ